MEHVILMDTVPSVQLCPGNDPCSLTRSSWHLTLLCGAMLHPVHLMSFNVALSDFLTEIRPLTLHQNHRGRPGASFPGYNFIRKDGC